MDTNALFGWDLTFKIIEKDVRRKSDILIAFIHWNLTKRGFRNIGIGDERTLTGEEEKTELLPNGWNDKDYYTLRYILEDKLYILHVINSDGNLIINLLRSDDLAVSNLVINIDESVQTTNGNIEKLMPAYKDLMYNIKRDLIDTVTENPTTNAETQTRASTMYKGKNVLLEYIKQNAPSVRRPDNDPLRIPPRPMPCGSTSSHDLWDSPPRTGVGRSDLDPFAPGGGGMIFNPFGPRRDIENPGLGVPGGLPRGAVPPGARFDPFAPPGVGPRPGRRQPPPDADHFHPPGFNDNMFL